MANKQLVAIHVADQYVETARMREGASSASTRVYGYEPSEASHRRLERVLNHYMETGRIAKLINSSVFGPNTRTFIIKQVS